MHTYKQFFFRPYKIKSVLRTDIDINKMNLDMCVYLHAKCKIYSRRHNIYVRANGRQVTHLMLKMNE